MIRGGVRRFAPWLLAFAAYTALTLVTMWPVVTGIASALPHDAADPALNTWILWWNAHAVPLTERWWNAPMFWPIGGALALSEHLVGISVLTTPLQWVGLHPLTAYNVAFLISFPLSALAAHALAFTLAKRHDAAALAGLIFGFNPYRTAQVSHLQMLWAFGMPLALMALHRYIDTRERAWLAAFTAAWLLQALANGYYLLFFPVLLACWVLWFAAGRSRAAAAIAAAWLAASLVLVPFLWSYSRIHRTLRLERGMTEIESFSADATALAAGSPDVVLWRRLSNLAQVEGELFPGALALVLVTAAAAAALRRARRWTRADRDRFRQARVVLCTVTVIVVAVAVSPLVIGPWQISRNGTVFVSVGSTEKPLSIAWLLVAAIVLTSRMTVRAWKRRSTFAFYLLAAALMFVLSLGPHARFAGRPVLFRAPYYVLMQLPGFSSVRAPGRFGMLFVLCLASAAAIAFARLTSSASVRTRQGLAFAACVLIAAESWPAIGVAAVPHSNRRLERVRDSTPILELPVGIVEHDSAAVYRAIAHRRRLVNGYSGYTPPQYLVLTIGLRMDDERVLQELARDESLTVVVDQHEDPVRWSALVDRARGRLVDDDGEWRVYRLDAVDSSARGRPAIGEPLRVQSIDANAGTDLIGRMVDGDPTTAWSSRHVQTGGEEVTIDLGSERSVFALRLMHGLYPYDFPRRLLVECAGDTGSWTECWKGSTAALALRGMLEDVQRAPMTIPIGRDGVRRLRLRQTGADAENGWSIVELSVVGR